jgi:hypothetical protein
MQRNPGDTWNTITQARGNDIIIPGEENTIDVLSDGFRAFNDPPDSLQVAAVIQTPNSQDYTTMRWEVSDGDTFYSISERLKETLIREYRLGPDGRIHFVNYYVISSPTGLQIW